MNNFSRWFIISFALTFLVFLAAVAFSFTTRAQALPNKALPPPDCRPLMDKVTLERTAAGDKFVSVRNVDGGYRFDYLNKATATWTLYFVISDQYHPVDGAPVTVYSPCAVGKFKATVYVMHTTATPDAPTKGWLDGDKANGGLIYLRGSRVNQVH